MDFFFHFLEFINFWSLIFFKSTQTENKNIISLLDSQLRNSIAMILTLYDL